MNFSLANITIPIMQNRTCAFWQPKPESPVIRGLLIAMYGGVGVTSFIGNAIVLFAVLSKTGNDTITNLFVANLAVSDLVLICGTLWVKPNSILYNGNWTSGYLECVLADSLSSLTFTVSSLTLAFMSLDRLVLVKYPMKARPKRKSAFYLILAIWVGGVMIVSPAQMHIRHVTIPQCGNASAVYFCVSTQWNPDYARLIYGVFCMVMRAVFPFIVVCVCHFKVAKTLEMQMRRLSDSRKMSRGQVLVRNKRIQKLLLAMVIIFGTFCIPKEFFSLLRDLDWLMYYQTNLMSNSVRKVGTAVADLIAMLAMFWNPVLYARFNENVRKHVAARYERVRRSLPSIKRKKSAARRTSGNENIPFLGMTA